MKKDRIQQVYMMFAVCVLTFTVLTVGCTQTSPPRGYGPSPRPEPSPSPPPRQIIPQPRERVNVDVWFDKQCGTPYGQGEKILISFKTTVDAYVTVYDIDTRGNVSVLFPNRHYPDNFVKGNRTYTMPNPDYTYDLVVEGPEGIEYVDVVASTDPYYRWNYNQGEPRWVDDWGLKGQQKRTINPQSSQRYKESTEYQKRPQQFGEVGTRSIKENYARSRALREQIRSKIVTRPRDQQYDDYATATCYFYVVSYQQQPSFQRIPVSKIPQPEDPLFVGLPNRILFDRDSYKLSDEARLDLGQIADILMRYPETTIIVTGHTDNIEGANHKQLLSEYRAQSVTDYLVSRGVQARRITSIGYGDTRPITSNATETERKRNRRVELELKGKR
jgi:outer membrane protein OmpA-like peptidoglycan-associated protein